MDTSLPGLIEMLASAVHSHLGTAIAAAVLSLLMWVLQKAPFVKGLLAKVSWGTKAAMVFLAVAPAVITSLSSKASWMDASLTALLTFLTATGVDTLLPKAKTA